MNRRQVEALARLMVDAQPPRGLYAGEDEPPPELHVSLHVVQGVDDGNTYEARLWAIGGLQRFPDVFYLRSDGTVYVYDSETDTSRKLLRVAWEPDAKRRHYWTLNARVAEEVLA